MRITSKDAYASFFVAAGVLAALAVTQGWNVPLMNGVRMGAIVLGLAGIVACAVSGWADEVIERRMSWTDPIVVLAGVLGAGLLVLAVIALVTNQVVWLALMIAVTLALWLLTLLHRLFAGIARRPATTT